MYFRERKQNDRLLVSPLIKCAEDDQNDRLLVSPLIKCAEDDQKPKRNLTQKMKKRYAFKHQKQKKSSLQEFSFSR